MTTPTCSGMTKSGKPCGYKGRYNGFCKLHEPKELPDCPICYEGMAAKDTVKTCCNHSFHRLCLQQWVDTNPSCPLCRHTLPTPRIANCGSIPRVAYQHIDLTQDSPRPRSTTVYINTDADLDHFLASVRNAPIDIQFTGEYWS